ncbi:MAG: GNAT family N-acetyltransferase [Myxococcota bacterium]|nr:GNAT family N-acetyltransferase [Myxococcota bacterium]
MAVEIRELRDTDVPALERFLEGRDRERASACLPALRDGDARGFVAASRDGGETAVGWVLVHLRLRDDQGFEPGGGTTDFQGGGHAYLENVEVMAGSRGRGIGSRLLERAESDAMGHDVHTLWLHVRESNRAAQRLYERRGWVRDRRVEPTWIDEPMLVYRLVLEAPGRVEP